MLKVLKKNNIIIKKLTHKEVIKYIGDIIIKEGQKIKVKLINSKKATQFRIWATNILKESG